MPNPFAELIDSGRIADEAALKRAFRAAAKRIHPDMLVGADVASRPGAADGAGPASDADALRDAESAARAFIALRADYEAALGYLAARRGRASGARGGEAAGRGGAAPGSIRPLAFSRERFYPALEELVGRGFPRRPRAAYPRAAYDASRERLLSYLAGRDEVYPEEGSLAAFLAFEAGYASLARPGSGWLSVENDPARSIYFLLSDVLLFHENGFPHLAAFARNVLPVTESLLRERGETRPLAFLGLLVADLDAGPACED
ncbi:MAG TPA: hypothetical protein PLB91_08980 [Spirochaetales bacterium]|nr:hypothetical protein [Spirochaetales bacterium]HRY53260.1 hypothetical protein [Spirochaetia bacterium]HRZ65157.1 hypothetical protein [Spirochaetia bacterium]